MRVHLDAGSAGWPYMPRTRQRRTLQAGNHGVSAQSGREGWYFRASELISPVLHFAGRVRQRRGVCRHRSGKSISPDLRGDSTVVRLRLKNSRSFVCLGLFQRELIGDVVLVDIADVLDGFLSDVLRRHEFDIPEPLIGVEPFCHCLFP